MRVLTKMLTKIIGTGAPAVALAIALALPLPSAQAQAASSAPMSKPTATKGVKAYAKPIRKAKRSKCQSPTRAH